MKLDLGCGQRKEPGFVGVDIEPVGDVVVDLFSFPWPFADASVDEIRAQHFVEHIPHWRPGWRKDGWWLFWDEMYRVCKPGAIVEVTHPYSRSDRAFIDPTHTRYVHEHTWLYMDQQWVAENKLDHGAASQFEVVGVQFLTNEASRHDIVRDHPLAFSHWMNITDDLGIRLRRRP